jgi:hypothetical protein
MGRFWNYFPSVNSTNFSIFVGKFHQISYIKKMKKKKKSMGATSFQNIENTLRRCLFNVEHEYFNMV